MITISLCMIVKNEEDVLGRILGQMKEIADEIIIVDTGSTDRTKEIAGRYTALIYDYPWNQDFAAARNFAVSKASGDYWMWLDADDVVQPDQQRKLLLLKEQLNPSVDIVMMKYLTGFDQDGNVTFSYDRERLIKNGRGFTWKGRVHEAITPAGNILYSPVEIEHRKVKVGDSDRNLNIYETMLAESKVLEPRHQYYYGRELYYHQRYEDAVSVFMHFLEEPNGWTENKIDACLQMSYCYEHLGKLKEQKLALLTSFLFDLPRGEICCELGRLMMEQQDYHKAVYWYEQALSSTPPEDSGAFIQRDCYGYIPCIQLCVCYDKLKDYQKAFQYHLRSRKLKPDTDAVHQNQQYFQNNFKEFYHSEAK